jgi:hypothetical protein
VSSRACVLAQPDDVVGAPVGGGVADSRVPSVQRRLPPTIAFGLVPTGWPSLATWCGEEPVIVVPALCAAAGIAEDTVEVTAAAARARRPRRSV